METPNAPFDHGMLFQKHEMDHKSYTIEALFEGTMEENKLPIW